MPSRKLVLSLTAFLTLGCGESRSAPKGPPIPGKSIEGKHGTTPAGKTLPDAWYVAWGYADGTWLANHPYSTREKAEAELKSNDIGVDVEFRKVVKDSPREKIRVDGRDIFRDVDLTLRENWLKRHEEWARPQFGQSADAFVFTWSPGQSDEILRARLWGPAPRKRGEPWPVCRTCRKPMAFVASMDYRETPFRQQVPGDAITLYGCKDCPITLEHCALSWLSAGEDLVLQEGPEGTFNKITHLGTRWLLKDYAGTFNLMDKDNVPDSHRAIFGHSPYFHVTLYASKVGGHAFWIQQDQTPKCDCGNPMRFVGQIETSEELGPMGLVTLFRCAKSLCSSFKAVRQCF
jgi:hypothetical protein